MVGNEEVALRGVEVVAEAGAGWLEWCGGGGGGEDGEGGEQEGC